MQTSETDPRDAQIFGDKSAGHIRVVPSFAPGCARIELCQPRARNAMSAAMWQGLIDGFTMLADHADVRVILLAGAGADFCSGADISEFSALRGLPDETKVYNARVRLAMATIIAAPCPVIAEIRGICMGAGLAMAAMADLRLVAEQCQIAVPAARLGVAYDPDWVARLVAVSALDWVSELLFTARVYSGREASARGLGAQVHPDAALPEAAMAMAGQIARGAPLTMRATKAALHATILPTKERHERAVDLARLCDQSQDYANAVAAFSKGEPVVFKGK